VSNENNGETLRKASLFFAADIGGEALGGSGMQLFETLDIQKIMAVILLHNGLMAVVPWCLFAGGQHPFGSAMAAYDKKETGPHFIICLQR
jgi:hypothetical protein